ncbi:MAG: type IV pilin protein [Gammaproteobacteria bacterium]|nr:type IV pilin protein [Gammaproteobacteria bacterium]
MRGFSLIELLLALAILTIASAIALPIYNAYSVRAERTGIQADLMRCVQGMERHANVAMSYEGAVDTDGDGAGDASTGLVSANICRVEATAYTVTVQEAEPTRFVLRARAVESDSLVGRDGMLELDSAGGRRWDRNNDGDFDDDGETGWRP